jgi:hypothetical protein
MTPRTAPISVGNKPLDVSVGLDDQPGAARSHGRRAVTEDKHHDALKSSIAALPSSPSVAELATVTKDAASVASSVKSFMDASNSKCS